MLTPYEEKQRIFSRLQEIEKVVNPTNNPFYFPHNHKLCAERDRLIAAFYELRRYEEWFYRRRPSLCVATHITGATAIQARINFAVAFNTH